MPFATQQEMKNNILNDIAKLVETFKQSFSLYIYLLENPIHIDEYLYPVGQLMFSRFKSIAPRNQLENDEIDSFRQQALSIVKSELLQKLLITVNAEKFSTPPSAGTDLLVNKIYEFIFNHYCNYDHQTKLRSVKPGITDARLEELFAGIVENPLDFIFKNLVRNNHEQLLISFERFNLDKNAYQLWSYTKKLGHMVGFKLAVQLKVSLTMQGREVGSLELKPDDSTDNINGLNWNIDILDNFLINNLNENHLNVMNDTNRLARSYKYTSYARNNNELLAHYNNDEPISMSVGWHNVPMGTGGHGVSVALYKDFLIYCNRGNYAGFEITNGNYIYKISNKPTIDTFNSLNKAHNSVADFTTALSQAVTNLKMPFAIIPLKTQNRGNCVFANSKSLMKGLLFCFEITRNNDPQGAVVYAHVLYKRITANMRDTVMLDLAATINHVIEIHKLKFIHILSLLIIEHHTKQQDRIFKSLNILTHREVAAVVDLVYKNLYGKELDFQFENRLLDYVKSRANGIEPVKRPITSIARFFGPKTPEIRTNPDDQKSYNPSLH